MKNLITKLAFAVLAAGFLLPATSFAYSPTLSLSQAGGDNVTVTVNGDSYASIELNYTLSGSNLPTKISNFGMTNQSGYFSTTISASAYGLNSGAQVYVVINGQQSPVAQLSSYGGGCTYNCGSPYGLSLSQTTVNLSVGQTQTVTIYNNNNYYNNFYISSNSNSNAVSASISGSQINLYGLANGSSTISVCAYGYSYSNSACASIYVNVSGSVAGASTYSVSIRDNFYSPQTITIPQGSSITWRNDGSMSHTVTFNNPYSDSNTIYSGNTYTKTFFTPGTYNYHCNFHSGMTGTVIVTSSSGSGSGSLWFSPPNPGLYAGQSLAVSVNSNVANSSYLYSSNAYYVSSNSNGGVVSASVSGTVLNLYGLTGGSSNITVCHSSLNFCGTLYVTVNGSNSGGNNLSLSPTSLNLSVGQSSAVNAYFNTGYGGNLYISNNTNPNVAYGSVSGNAVNIYATNPGTTTMTICQSQVSQCGTVYVTVGSSGSGYNNLTITNTNLPSLTVGQYYNFQLQAAGGVYPYTYSINSGSLPAGLSLSTSGQLFGTPQYNLPANFSVRVTDSYGRNGVAYFTITPTGGSGGVLGTSTYNNGQLISEAGTVYIVYKNTKIGFANAAAFTGLGFNFNQVINVGFSGLATSGYIISTSNSAHPWGAWIKSGQTVYFAHELGLIPVPDWNTFLNNGGNSNLIVPANSYDFQRSVLSVMVNGDSRLR